MAVYLGWYERTRPPSMLVRGEIDETKSGYDYVISIFAGG